MNEQKRQMAPTERNSEKRESGFDIARRVLNSVFEITMEQVKFGKINGAHELRSFITRAINKAGIESGRILLQVIEAVGDGSKIKFQIGPKKSGDVNKSANGRGLNSRIAFFSALLSDGCIIEKISDSGDTGFGDSQIDSDSDTESTTCAEEVASITPPDCGDKPENAPDECGTQQWLGYAEDNPAAVVWAALANTGDRSCTVTISRLELSYKSKNGKSELLSDNINGVQALSDGTDTDNGVWGTYMYDIAPNTSFTIEPGSGAYIHPFGDMVEVPSDATELTITFSAEVEEGCSASGGIDTYEEFASPPGDPEKYTQDGSTTDYIKEIIKTPWFTCTIDPEEAISYSVVHTPTESKK